MPYQRTHPQNIPLLKSPWEQDFANLLQKGMQLRHEPERLLRQKEQEELSNILRKEQGLQAQAETPFIEDKNRADLGYKLAQTKLAEQKAENPLLTQLTGFAREAAGLDAIKNMHGEESQVYQDARKLFESKLRNAEILSDYRQSLGGTANKRASTTLGKMEMEISDIMNRRDLSTQEKESALSRYKLARQKQISDSDSRKRALFASNVDKTLENINEKDLVQYGGAKGQAKLQIDKIRAATGKAPKEYERYQDALTGAKLLSKQIRQFYGDSITPQVQEQLSEMVNPSTWANNPDVALKKFNTFKKILQAETETYRDALKNTKEFESQNFDDQKQRNMDLLRKQRQMAEALKKQQPKMIGESNNQNTNTVKRFKYVNGAWVNA